MILPLKTTMAGRLQILQVPGNIVENGDVLAKIAVDDPSKIQRPKVFSEPIPNATVANAIPEYVVFRQ